jgi:hypothetical protein
MIIWNILISILVLFYFYEIPIYIAWGPIFWTVKDKYNLEPGFPLNFENFHNGLIFAIDSRYHNGI